MINTTLSDLFFNYGPAERAYRADASEEKNESGLFLAAEGFLSMTGNLFSDVTAEELAEDFLNRL